MPRHLDVSEIVNDADLAEPFTIQRSSGGQFVAGGWQETQSVLDCYGVVSVATAEDLEMVPEGDRVQGAMAFWATVQLYETHVYTNEQGYGAGGFGNVTANPATSDILWWNNTAYRIISVKKYVNSGYWKAIAARMKGA